MDHAPAPPAQPKGIPTVSSRLGDGRFIELVYDKATRATAFAVFADGKALIQSAVNDSQGGRLIPISPKNNLIRHQVLLLAEYADPFGSVADLLAEIERYLYRYVDLSDPFLRIASYYVLLSWVYDAFNELPYLRVRGDFGCGKTRALLVIGSICYLPFFASGASTVSPIFHIIDTFRGTLIFDEADFRFSDEKAELVKILNNGNVRGFPVLRASVNPKRNFDPEAFSVFGPKLVAMREAFQDPALESRFLTEEMGQRPLREGIPVNLPDIQQEEAQALRNKLLWFRFTHLPTTKVDPTQADPALSPRLNQILIPLLSVVQEETIRNDIRRAARALDRRLGVERSATPEGQLLAVLLDLWSTATTAPLSVADLAQRFTERWGAEYQRPITNRYVGSLLRSRLRLSTYKSHGVYVIPLSELPKAQVLAKRYGLLDASSGGRGEVGSTATPTDIASPS